MDAIEFNKEEAKNPLTHRDDGETFMIGKEELAKLLLAIPERENTAVIDKIAEHGVEPKVEVIGSNERMSASFSSASQDMIVIKSTSGATVAVNLRNNFPQVYTNGSVVETTLYMNGKKVSCTITNKADKLYITISYLPAATKRSATGYTEQLQSLRMYGLTIDGEEVLGYTKKVYGKPDDPSFDKNIPDNRQLVYNTRDGLFYLNGVDEGKVWADKYLVMINLADLELNKRYDVKDAKYGLPLKIRIHLDSDGIVALHVRPSPELLEKYSAGGTPHQKPTVPEKKPPVEPVDETENPEDEERNDGYDPDEEPPVVIVPGIPPKKSPPKITPEPSPKQDPESDEKVTPPVPEKNIEAGRSALLNLLNETLTIENGGRVEFDGEQGKLYYKRVRGIPDEFQERVEVVYKSGKFYIRVKQKILRGALPYTGNAGSFTTKELESGDQDVWYEVGDEKIGGLVTAKREGDALRIHRGKTESKAKESTVETYQNRVLPFNEDAPIKRISSEFHNQRKTHLHEGIDISLPEGQSIYSVAAGVVTESRLGTGYGHQITVDHGNGLKTRYAHLSYRSVQQGQKIKGGQTLGISGNTGVSEAPHLHFEVIKSGTPVNPALYIDFSRRDIDNKLKGVKPKKMERGSGVEFGEASFYNLRGKTTASGELYSPYAMKAAHNTLPFGTRVKVSRTDNPSKSVEVQINDRGPFVGGRIIDLSVAAAEKLGIAKNGKSVEGVTKVKVEVIK